MKTLKAICAAAVLAISLSIPAYADDPTPPPPGDIHVPGQPITGETSNPPPPDSGDTVDDLGFPALADILWTLASIF